MTIEQLLCPDVMMWEHNFRNKLNESNIVMTDDQIFDEFKKWLVENEDKINKSVEDNIDVINESIRRGMENARFINEGISSEDVDAWDFFDMDDDEDEEPEEKDEKTKSPEPTEDEKLIDAIDGPIELVNDKKGKDIFKYINSFYEMVRVRKLNNERFSSLMRLFITTNVVNMNALFAFADLPNIDLSKWNVSNVRHMEGMFYKSSFNNDSICEWSVSRCSDFKNMFLFCPFNKSLIKWRPAEVEKTYRNSAGDIVKKRVPADLPVIGAVEDEGSEDNKIMKTTLNRQLDKYEKEMKIKENNMERYIKDFDTFVNEGMFRDFINKGIDKVKDIFRPLAIRLGKIVPFFKNDGHIYNVVSPYTTLNVASSGEIKGVSAFCKIDNELLDNVPSVASIPESNEYYGYIKNGSTEYNNYITFLDACRKGSGSYSGVNEERIGLHAESANMVAEDIDSEGLKDEIRHLILDADRGGKPIFIWGGPGIGKSTIPKAIIEEWNAEHKENKKALVVIQCGDLTIDGFSLPMPVTKSIKSYLEERPESYKKIKEMISDDEIDSISSVEHLVSIEAPKTWFPGYKMSDAKTNAEAQALNALANGRVEISDKRGKINRNETTDGGILLLDEFFRANTNIFKILMQLVETRSYGGYKLGSKWAILACSNRPSDDQEVALRFGESGSVIGNRFGGGIYNFVPSFDDWKHWAITEGDFDEITLSFIIETDHYSVPGTGEVEYTRWHNEDPQKYNTTAELGWPSPRSWSRLMEVLRLYKEDEKLASIYDIPKKTLLRKARAIIGRDIGQQYVDYALSYAANLVVDTKELMKNPSYNIPATAECGQVCKQISNHIKVCYDHEHLPDVEGLVNIYKAIAERYDKTKDNYVKKLHYDIIKHLHLVKDDSIMKKYFDYLNPVKKTYLNKEDLIRLKED